ncbi:MAG: hypothetical protein ABI647_21090, partial [Gemmatimonadota bacterium]
MRAPVIYYQLTRRRFVATVVRSAGDTMVVVPAKGGPQVVLPTALSSDWPSARRAALSWAPGCAAVADMATRSS